MGIEQKKAVYNAVVSLYRDNNRHFEDGNTVKLSTDERKTIIHIVSQGLQSGSILISETAKKRYDTPKKMHNYATGLVSDRLRKDKRLNGDTKYEIQKQGSRAGAGDAVIKELREYKRRHCTTLEQRSEVDVAIENRLNEIRTEKLENTNINMDVVNACLQKVRTT